MPKRSFDDNFWGDTFVQELDKDAKLLFLYLWTNKRCNSAGLYEITPKTITFETGISTSELPKLFEILKEKVVWIPDQNIVWVKNFLKNQPQSPQFLKAVCDCLYNVNSNGIVDEYRSYYHILGVSIPYKYRSNTTTKGWRYISEEDIELEQEPDNNTSFINEGDENLSKFVKCYESNLGQITPNIAEELKVLSEEYNGEWFEEAVKECCNNNVRKLSYAKAILQRWQVEGFKSTNKKKKKGTDENW